MDRLVPLLCLNIEGFCAQLGQHNSVEGEQWGRGTARQIKALAVTSRAADFGTADKVRTPFLYKWFLSYYCCKFDPFSRLI